MNDLLDNFKQLAKAMEDKASHLILSSDEWESGVGDGLTEAVVQIYDLISRYED